MCPTKVELPNYQKFFRKSSTVVPKIMQNDLTHEVSVGTTEILNVPDCLNM